MQLIRQTLGDFFTNGWVIALLVVLGVFGFAYLALVLRYRSLRKKHLRERRAAEQRRRMERELLWQESQFGQDFDEARQFRSFDPDEEEGDET